MIKLGSHVKVENGWWRTIDAIKADEGIDLEVCKVEIDIHGIQAGQKVDKGFLLFCGDMCEESVCPDLARWESRVDANVESKGFGIYVSDFDTTLVGKENGIALTRGGDTDIVFGVGWMGEEGFEDEVVQGSGDGFDLIRLG